MSMGLLNPAMLAGLLAMGLPVAAHLISKRKFDVIQWGAMQFLELGRRTRRRVRLEEFLLLFLRMAVIGVIVLALARPWAKGSVFSKLTKTVNRDIVLIVDGSYSMGWEGRGQTPDQAARQWALDCLETLQGSDTVALLDARDQLQVVIENPSSDLPYIREQINALPKPAGTSNLALAVNKALQILSHGNNPSREVIVLTDGQQRPWKTEDTHLWARIDDQRKQLPTPPHIWVVDLVGSDVKDRINYSVDRLKLSRELTVPDFPIRIQTTIRQSGGQQATRKVFLEIDGQRLEHQVQTIQIPPNGESSVEFEHRFPSTGTYVVSVVLERDQLPGDDRADAAVVVTNGVPALIVDGSPHLDPTRSESFYVKAAFDSAGRDSAWVRAKVITTNELNSQTIADKETLFLCNVAKLDDAQLKLLVEFVARGGGLVIAPGDQVDSAWFQKNFYAGGKGLAPAQLIELRDDEKNKGAPTISLDGLDLPWMKRFNRESGIDFTETRANKWWRMQEANLPAADVVGKNADPTDPLNPRIGGCITAARLSTKEPFLVGRSFGAGTVFQLAVPLDTDWCTLPAKNDFVPFLHEMVFVLMSRSSGRNTDVGSPLVFRLPAGVQLEELEFITPADVHLPAERWGTTEPPQIRLATTQDPGIYRLITKRIAGKAAADGKPSIAEAFVVEFDRSESDLTGLDKADREMLCANDRLKFTETNAEVLEAAAVEAPHSEMWRLLMLVVLASLVFEVYMTRRMVQGGHALLDVEGV